MNVQQLAMTLIRQNPNVAHNPQAQEMLGAIENNDSVKGKAIAQNLCNTYGVTRDQAVAQAKRYFGIR